jgi:hypothetical protein
MGSRDLEAENAEYEHALEEVVACGKCEDCKTVAQSALDGLNREDFLDMILEGVDFRERL